VKFSDFKKYQPKPNQNIFGFICEDAFLVEESREVWRSLFSGNWIFEKYAVKEFEDIPAARLMDEALTPSLFSESRVLLVTNAEKVTKARIEDLVAMHSIVNSSLKIVLVTANRKATDSWSRVFPLIEIDQLRPADVARWLMERYKLTADIARYLVDNVGTELYPLHTEVEKLRTYVGESRPVETRDVDVLILRSEQFGPFELDDAVLARNYKKAVQVIGSMLDDGVEPLLILSRIVRVWRQLFVGKGLSGKSSAKDVAMASMVPAFKAGDFVAACRKFEWKQLALGFRELLYADRAFKTSSPDPRVYFDVMLWKLIG
jgi:DNA polymerase-3 subunit delta